MERFLNADEVLGLWREEEAFEDQMQDGDDVRRSTDKHTCAARTKPCLRQLSQTFAAFGSYVRMCTAVQAVGQILYWTQKIENEYVAGFPGFVLWR